MTTGSDVIDRLMCSALPCTVVVADDLGDGWVRARGTFYISEADRQAFCSAHKPEDSFPAEGEINMLTYGVQ